MDKKVSAAIRDGIVKRTKILEGLTIKDRQLLLERLFIDLFGHQHVTLQKWSALTGQSAQVDTGYIAQFVASIALGIPGQGFRGKGDDLADGSEVKGAANISGVDRPRWNHNFGKISEDQKRRDKGEQPVWELYKSAPNLFYLLVDRVVGGDTKPAPIRIRAWRIRPQEDLAWRGLVDKWLENRGPSTYNFQLHPPVGWPDDIVVNTLGNLDFADVRVFDAQLDLTDPTLPAVTWVQELTDLSALIGSQSSSLPYGRDRPSRLTTAEDIVADISRLPSLFPGILDSQAEDAIEDAALAEVENSASNADS